MSTVVRPEVEPFKNPFLMAYTAIIEMLLKEQRFQAVIEPKNTIRFDTKDRDVLKMNPISSDYPEVMLLPTGATQGNMHATSSSSRIVFTYSFVVSTGDYRYEKISAVEWAIYAGCSKWCSELTTLLWDADYFVKDFNLSGSQIGETEDMKRRGLNGWASSWTAEVLMNFSAQTLRNGLL